MRVIDTAFWKFLAPHRLIDVFFDRLLANLFDDQLAFSPLDDL